MDLYFKGFDIMQIKEKTNYQSSLIYLYIREYNQKQNNNDSSLFNVDEYDCWIFPTKKDL